MKILAEPNLVTVSGRPASYQVGGEVPYPQPTGFGNISIEFKPFGTKIDFVPIVLGNGSVRLEVRPQVRELDESLGILVHGTTVPGFTSRYGRHRRGNEVRPDAGHRRLAAAAHRESEKKRHSVPDGPALHRRRLWSHLAGRSTKSNC